MGCFAGLACWLFGTHMQYVPAVCATCGSCVHVSTLAWCGLWQHQPLVRLDGSVSFDDEVGHEHMCVGSRFPCLQDGHCGVGDELRYLISVFEMSGDGEWKIGAVLFGDHGVLISGWCIMSIADLMRLCRVGRSNVRAVVAVAYQQSRCRRQMVCHHVSVMALSVVASTIRVSTYLIRCGRVGFAANCVSMKSSSG